MVIRVSIINASDPRHPEIIADYRSPEALGCVPIPAHSCDSAFAVFNSAHDLTLLVHPDTSRVLLYVAYWDSGLRIVDVTNPRHPAEIGALDYTPTFTKQGLEATCCAHYAQPTPSGHRVLLEDEIGIGLAGGVHILRADGCDGVRSCTLAQVSSWSRHGAGTQASAIHATINTNGSLFPAGIIQRFFTRDVHNLDVQEDRFLAPAYSSGVFLVDIHDKAAPFVLAFWQGAANVKTAWHGQNTLIPWGYQGDCFFQGREVWGAKFGEAVPGSPSDFYIYASDFWDGFLILRTVNRYAFMARQAARWKPRAGRESRRASIPALYEDWTSIPSATSGCPTVTGTLEDVVFEWRVGTKESLEKVMRVTKATHATCPTQATITKAMKVTERPFVHGTEAPI